MKKNSFLIHVRFIFILLFICPQLHAKPLRPHAEKIPAYFFFRPYTQCQYFFYKKQEGTLDIKFPYTLTGENGNSTHTFSSTKTNLTGTGKYSHTFPGIEIGYGRFSVDANMNFVTGPVWGWTDNFYFGMNYRLPSPFSFLPRDKINAAVVLPDAPTEYNAWSISLHLGILYYHPLYKLGEIDIEKNYFTAANQSVPHRDTTILYPGKVSVYFQHNTIALVPAFELGYQLENYVVDFGIRIAPLIMLSQEGGLRFRYKNSSQMAHAPGGYNLDYIRLAGEGIDARYNGTPISSTPFSLNGFQISLRVGVRFGAE
jgi:hypothetical protein